MTIDDIKEYKKCKTRIARLCNCTEKQAQGIIDEIIATTKTAITKDILDTAITTYGNATVISEDIYKSIITDKTVLISSENKVLKCSPSI